MKILCVWHDEEPKFLAPNPEEELRDHEIHQEHTSDDAKRIINHAFDTQKPFDILITDSLLPGNQVEPVACYGPILSLHSYSKGIKVCGIFVPDYCKEIGFQEDSQNQELFLAANQFETLSGHRDWKKMLSALIFRAERTGIRL